MLASRKSKLVSLFASETEYEFCRKLIEDNLIPDDVTIQVLDTGKRAYY